MKETYDIDWKRSLSTLVGLDTAATAQFSADEDALRIEVGGGKWLEKAAVAGVGYVAFPALLIPAGIGVWKQKKLFDELQNEIRYYIENETSKQPPLDDDDDTP